jgi:phosphopantothenoylcysteine decarboxylase/phosphopantothenate--cysteine ligase
MKVALGVTGGIAAYKAAEIVRLLQDRGVRVQVIMTRAAQEFIRPLTFAALSGEKVITGMFAPGEEHAANIDSAIEHIAVAQSIDALLVAPATADVLAHFAQGIAGDFLTTLYLATTAPVVVAPAMNVNMWNHPATQSNLEILRQRGVKIVEPGSGYLACGMTGSGRLAENETIVAALLETLGALQDLDARKNRSRALLDQPLQRTHGLRRRGSRCAPRSARAAGQWAYVADAAGCGRSDTRGIGRANARCRAQPFA